MSPSTAVKLVESYARLTKEIKLRTREIGEHLERCKGVSGVRGVMNPGTYTWLKEPDVDAKGRDKDLHLWAWYQPETVGDGYYTEPRLVWERLTAEEHGAQCPHCYAAHLAVQARKLAKKQLGAVKGAMTRSAAC